MPQMSPFNWTLMFLIFISALMISLCKLYTLQPHFSLSKQDPFLKNYMSTNKKWMW